MKEGILIEIEDLPEEGDNKMMEDPPKGPGGPPDGRGPPDGGGPPMMEDLLMEMEDLQDTLIEENHQDLEDLLDQ